MLRAVLVIALILLGIRYSLKGPFYALLFYLWIGYFRPESWLWWDFFTQLNLSLIVGVVVLGATLLGVTKLQGGWGPILMILLLLQSLLSTFFSPAFDYSFLYWQDFAKSTIISFLIVSLVDSESKLRLTQLVIALSLGFEAAKQGWAQLLLNPGAVNLNPVSNLGDNNGVAVGMLMLLPVLVALARTAPWKWERYGFRFMAVGIVYRAVSTYSRGGFLALTAVGVHYLALSKKKVASALAIIITVAMIAPVLPDYFWERMNTIPTDTENIDEADGSIRSRIHFWRVAMVMANANPITGVGHMAYNAMYDQYDFSEGLFGRARSVHSTWFAVLSELGYPGALIFGLVLCNAFLSCRRAQRVAKRHPELKNLGLLGNAMEAGLIAFSVGGTFVIFQYTELLWHTLALSMALDRIVAARVAALVTATAVPPKMAIRPVLLPIPGHARPAHLRQA